MNSDIWYEEELLPPAEMADNLAKSLQTLSVAALAEETGLEEATLTKDKSGAVNRFARDKAKGRLTVFTPRARRVTPEEVADLSGSQSDLLAPGKLAQGPLFLVRLGLELDVDPKELKAGWGYRQAWCRAHLYAPGASVQPRLLDIYPLRLYEGQPMTVKVEAKPALKVEKLLEASLGSVSSDLRLGQVMPITLGFFGEAERKPYWQLQEKEKPIRGAYHFWLLVEQPPGCTGIRLGMLGEGDLRLKRFTIPVGPTERRWDRRREVDLLAIAA
jgi:hypothetical protein